MSPHERNSLTNPVVTTNAPREEFDAFADSFNLRGIQFTDLLESEEAKLIQFSLNDRTYAADPCQVIFRLPAGWSKP